MSKNDLQAARERWMRYDTAYNGDDDEQETDDAYMLADAYCELFDETPITEEFASTVRSSDVLLALDTKRQRWVMRVFCGSGAVRLIAQDVQTVGQVRLLLLAMGIEQETRGDA